MKGNVARKRCTESFESLLNVGDYREADVAAKVGVKITMPVDENERRGKKFESIGENKNI